MRVYGEVIVGLCEQCNANVKECKCELAEINQMRIENIKRQKAYLEKNFHLVSGNTKDGKDEI